MASQLKTKFIKNDAVDGSKLKLKNGETIRGTDGSGNEIDILANIDSSIASVQSSVDAEEVRALAAEGVLQTNINSVQAEVDAEEVRALAAESAISVSLSNEVTRATGVEAGLQSQIDSLSSSSSGSVAAEEARALAAELVLQNNIDNEASLRSTADTNLDMKADALKSFVGQVGSENFQPHVGAVHSQPATNVKQAIQYLDEAIVVVEGDLAQEIIDRGAAVSGVQSSLTQEISDRQSADSALDSRISVLESDPTTKTYVDGQISGVQSQIDNIVSNVDPGALDSLTEVVTAFQAADASLNGAITALASSASSGLAAEVSRAEAAEAALQSDIDAEETRALAAESALSSSISSEVSRATAAEGVLDGRLDILEPKVAALEAIVEAGHAKVLDSTDISNGYINLPHLIVGMLEMYVDKLRLHSIGSSPDFSISTVGGVTRVTFLNNMISPSEQALAAGDELFCYYKHS